MVDHKRYLIFLGIFFFIWCLILSINPYNRSDWALENALVVFAAIIIFITYVKVPLSRISYTLIFIFLCLHEIGAHYTYSRTPYDQWWQYIFGFSLNELLGFERNHYDRLIHFMYGLLLAYPVRELFIRIADVRGFWAYFLPFDITLSSSAMYELFEWAAATFFGGDLGIAYLGTQGDVWDTHKDMAFAGFGALIAMLITAMINFNLQRDFAKEWNESLRVKGKKPLGENAIIEMWKKRTDSKD